MAKERTKIKFYNSIVFQIVGINIVLLVVFNMIMYVTMGAMDSSVTTSNKLIDYIASTTMHENKISTNVYYLNSLPYSYLTAKNEDKAEIETQFKEKSEELQSSMETLCELTETNEYSVSVGLANSASILKPNVESYISMLDQALGYAKEGKTDKCLSLMSKDIKTMMFTIDGQIEELDAGLGAIIGGALANMNAVRLKTIGQSMFGLVLFVAALITNFVLTFLLIVKKVQSMSNEVNTIIDDINNNNGDLTARINTNVNSELVYFKEGFNSFIDNLQSVIKNIKDSTVVLTNSGKEVTRKIKKANDNVTNTSAALQELSASMDTVSSTATVMTERLSDVEQATKSINDEVEEGQHTAKEIKTEAEQVQIDVNHKKTNTGAKMEDLSKVLERSVHDSEQVNQIGELTNVILDIAAQTNLLALNASIEAARAGEAGRGFAVVAEEISALADNSRQTAANIQEISQSVTEAVTSLSENAMQVLDFINTSVLADYDSFVEVGEKYESTATLIEELMSKFSEKADNLNSIMNEMSASVTSINDSVQESSQAISMSATNSAEIVSEMQGITEAMDDNNDVTEQLSNGTKQFIKL